ncbi:MAG TPA: SpoIVB peptidase S55 domain-containing protein [Vicinamibacterales bacterium]|nr:SpoIVB peptidase S55 domain-containing protein [Vicinamibacterales bacterium]
MNLRTLCSIVVLGLLMAVWPSAAPRYMSVDEVRPGMVGVGRTVFQDDRVEEFKVHILGVLRNTIAPRRDMVLARLEGGPLANTGVIAGMSGSPVYIDGRLLGAVAYSLGQFSKEPIAGITPIEEMIETADPAARRGPTDKTRISLPVTRESMAAALRRAFARFERPFSEHAEVLSLSGDLSRRGSDLGVLLRPIATPLALGGFTGAVRETIAGAFRDSGFVAVPGAQADPLGKTGQGRGDATLRPGDAVGVNLVTGDFSIGATGTVTEVDGDKVYAFGHPLYNLGPTEFPMTRAHVFTLLPSLASSTKVAATGKTIGTFRQDRSTAIAGTLGQGPSLVPVNVALQTARGLKKTFRFEVVQDQMFTPLLTYVSILNTLSAYEREFGAATFRVKGKATVRRHGEVAFEDVFTGDSPSIGAAAYVVGPLNFLLSNDFEPVHLEGVDLEITTSEQPETVTIERVWLDAPRVRAGSTVPLRLLLRTYRGDEVLRTIPVDIPANATGSLSILVSDGSRLAQIEQRESRGVTQVQDLAQMIRVLNDTKKNNRLYVRLLSQDPGAVVNGEALPSLPPSVLSVLEGDRYGGSFSPLRNATLREWEVATDSAVSGTRILTVTLDPTQ